MGKALYREYRPKRLADVIGQEHVTTTLANALKSGAFSHAYLLTGPRGTGKTTIARILAHEVNGLPYDDDASHLDIIEIDAASNRRIDEIRELRERVHNAPTSSKYKVYIIDEVHMLTKEAFNALLKTLEEPPAHVIFVLATTEVHKLPDTIISRTQRFSLKPVSTDKVAAHLLTIAKQEGFDITPEAAALLSEAGGGSFRDSISLLDQARSTSANVTEADIYRVLGVAPAQAIAQLLKALTGTPGDVVTVLKQLRYDGYQSGQLAKQLAAGIRQMVVTEPSERTGDYLQLLHELLEVPYARDIDAKLELVLVGFALQKASVVAPGKTFTEPKRSVEPITDIAPAQTQVATDKITPPTASLLTETPVQAIEPASSQKPPVAATPRELPAALAEVTVTQPISVSDATFWPEVLGMIKQKYNTLYGVIRMAQPVVQGDTLLLTFKFGFHQKRTNEPRNKQIIADTIQAVTGQALTVVCEVNASTDVKPTVANTSAPAPAAAAPAAEPAGDGLAMITDVFGGGEVLES